MSSRIRRPGRPRNPKPPEKYTEPEYPDIEDSKTVVFPALGSLKAEEVQDGEEYPEFHMGIGGGAIDIADETFETVEMEFTMPLWTNNEIQFARLLCELGALGIPDKDTWNELMENMDLEKHELDVLFDRAEQVWADSKRKYC